MRSLKRRATLRQLRHSALTHDAEDGASARLLMTKSGHASIRTLGKNAGRIPRRWPGGSGIPTGPAWGGTDPGAPGGRDGGRAVSAFGVTDRWSPRTRDGGRPHDHEHCAAGPGFRHVARAGLAQSLAGHPGAQPGLFMRARRGAAACPQTGLRAAGHRTYRYLRYVRYGQRGCTSITPGGI